MSTELNIYQIEQEYLSLAAQLIENGGETNEELDAALAINKENFEIKSAKYAYVTKKFDDEVTLLDKEIERLTALKNSREKAKEKLKSIVKEGMLLYGVEKIETQNIKLSFRASKETIIDDAALLPKKYKTIVKVEKIDKKAVKNDLEAGVKVKGAHLQENKNLQIK